MGFIVKSNVMKTNPTIDIPQDLTLALQRTKHVVVFTGAGVSAESGIANFRDALTGLSERVDAADLATPEEFQNDEELVWGWYEWRRMQVLRAQPNSAHLAIAALARCVPTLTVITQNVDDLHERGGSVGVLHFHGSLHHPRCSVCSNAHTLPPGIPEEPEGGRRLCPPRCGQCGKSVRPGVVWFGEDLPVKKLSCPFAAARTLKYQIDEASAARTASILFLLTPRSLSPMRDAERTCITWVIGSYQNSTSSTNFISGVVYCA